MVPKWALKLLIVHFSKHLLFQIPTLLIMVTDIFFGVRRGCSVQFLTLTLNSSQPLIRTRKIQWSTPPWFTIWGPFHGKFPSLSYLPSDFLEPPPPKYSLSIIFHFTTNVEPNWRHTEKNKFLHSCRGSLVGYWSNNTWSTDNCFCHCNWRCTPHSRNYKCREMEGKSILFKSVLVSANTLLCH